jgi:hypothetical protein
LAIELPLQATTTRPPGTSKTIFPVDGLGVGDGEDDGVTLGVTVPAMAADVDPDGDDDALGDVEGVGVGVGDVVVTTPPIAFPFVHRYTYSVPVVGRTTEALTVGDADGGGGVADGSDAVLAAELVCLAGDAWPAGGELLVLTGG